MAERNVTSITLYAFATLVVAGSNFLATPMLLQLLGPEGFADWAKIEPLILAALPLTGLGIQIGLLNALNSSAEIPGRLLPFHLGATCLVAAAVGGVVYVVFGNQLGLLAGLVILFEGALLFFISFWRATNRPLIYALAEGGRAATVMGVLGLMLVYSTIALQSTVGYMSLRAAIGGGFVLLALFLVRWRWHLDARAARAAATYGLPIVLASVLTSALINYDRYAVASVAGDVQLSAYVAHVKIVQVLGSALAPFFIWFAPIAIAQLGQDRIEHSFFRRSFLGFSTVNFSLALGLWLITPSLWTLLFPDIPLDHVILATLIVGMVIYSMGNPLSVGSLREGRTVKALQIALLAVGIGLVAVPMLAHSSGVLGVAVGKGIAMFAYTAAFATHTIRTVKIGYPWPSIIALATLAAVLAWWLPTFLQGVSLWNDLPLAVAGASTVLAVGWFLDHRGRPRRA